MRFVNTIFCSDVENKISTNLGFNIISNDDLDAFEYYHKHINQIAIEYAHLSITCTNGELNSCSQSDWKNTSFNKIERYYSAPTYKYTKDIIHIINTKIVFEGSY